jgi:hypothetical protein
MSADVRQLEKRNSASGRLIVGDVKNVRRLFAKIRVN